MRGSDQKEYGVERSASGLRVLLALPGHGRNRQCYRCVLVGIEHGNVLLECEKWIEPSSDVVLTFDRITLKGTVRYCHTKHNAHSVSVAVADSESPEGRATPRFPMDEPGTLIALGDAGTAIFQCRLTDISRSGLGLKSESEVPVDSMICIETSSIMVAGKVRRCTPNDDGSFRVGVAVTDVLSDRGTAAVSVWAIAGIRLRLAEFILGRPIESVRRSTYASRSRR